MVFRSIRILLPLLLPIQLLGQTTVVRTGTTFTRELKNTPGDIHTVVAGVPAADGRNLLYVEEGFVHKVIRLDADLKPGDELVLNGVAFDGATWSGVAPVIIGDQLHCLLVSQGKRSADYAIGVVDGRGAPALNNLRRIASSDLPYISDPTKTLVHRALPDAILFNRGLAYVQRERITASADGQHFLLSNHTHDGKGAMRFWAAYLDKDFKELWSVTKELPFANVKSKVHQISLTNDGTIRFLTYVFACASEEQMKDKNCHEVHLTTLTDRGNELSDVLVDKDFVSTARYCERADGLVSIAIRYGALTGQPGVLMTFDPLDKKMKTNPVVDQRLPSIRKLKLMAFGSIEEGARKTSTSKIAKVPDEIVDLREAWNGDLLLVEGFLDNTLQIQMDDAIAMRRLCGSIRTTRVTADTVRWQHIAERAFMTTAGQAYEVVDIHMDKGSVTLLYDQTPRGFDAIMRSGTMTDDADGGKGKKDKPSAPFESGVLKAITFDADGKVLNEGTVLMGADGLLPCPMGSIREVNPTRFLVKSFDRGTGYTYSLIDISKVAE